VDQEDLPIAYLPGNALRVRARVVGEIAAGWNRRLWADALMTAWRAHCAQRWPWQSPEYDLLYQQSETEIDPVGRAALFIAMNDLVIRNVVVIPVVTRPQVSAVAKNLHVVLSGWDARTFAIQDWYRDV
jgi:ABC-type transport system substrate-binding protein